MIYWRILRRLGPHVQPYLCLSRRHQRQQAPLWVPAPVCSRFRSSPKCGSRTWPSAAGVTRRVPTEVEEGLLGPHQRRLRETQQVAVVATTLTARA